MKKDRPKMINLKYSIPYKTKREGKEVEVAINQLRLGRIKAKHLKLLPKNIFLDDESKRLEIDPADMIPLIAGMSNLPIETIEEIDLEDLGVVGEALSDFLSESLETGKISSTQ